MEILTPFNENHAKVLQKRSLLLRMRWCLQLIKVKRIYCNNSNNNTNLGISDFLLERIDKIVPHGST